MTKAQFLEVLQEIYRIANLADSDSPEREAWMHTDMAGHAY